MDDSRTFQHEAIQEEQPIYSDIWRDLFSRFFVSDQFERWQQQAFEHTEDRRKWQLRCIGGPGSGKTTLSSIVTGDLRAEIRKRGARAAVASIYIDRDIANTDDMFMAAVVDSLLRQLQADELPPSISGPEPNDPPHYTAVDLLSDSDRASNELEGLHARLHSTLHSLDAAFLVLDGIDLCGRIIGDKLEAELVSLQSQGLTIMVTSRIPRHQVFSHRKCSASEHQRRIGEKRLSIFWTCKDCWKTSEPAICKLCRANGARCPHCNNLSLLFEPYDHNDIELTVPSTAIHSFLAWDLEREHGDLRLHAYPDQKPPLSAVGHNLRGVDDDSSSNRLREDIVYLVDKAGDNITMAKLWLSASLDLIAKSSFDAHHTHNRLPPVVAAYFEDVLRPVKLLPVGDRKVALLAILATTRHGSVNSVVTWTEFVATIAQIRVTVDSTIPDIHSWTADHVAYLTNGLLTVDYQDGTFLYPSISSHLEVYAWQNYDAELSWLTTFIPRAALSRSNTGMKQQTQAGRFQLARQFTNLRAGRKSTMPLNRRPTLVALKEFSFDSQHKRSAGLDRRQTSVFA